MELCKITDGIPEGYTKNQWQRIKDAMEGVSLQKTMPVLDVNELASGAERREFVKKQKRLQRQPMKIKAYARSIVRSHLKSGKIKRCPCEICGTDQNIHAHHDNYMEPLQIRWLCRDHHNEWHRYNVANYDPDLEIT